MRKNIDVDKFIAAFESSQYHCMFSREGLILLFEYLNEVMDEGFVLNVHVIACAYTEQPPMEILTRYPIDTISCSDYSEENKAIVAYLTEKTKFIGRTEANTFVYASFYGEYYKMQDGNSAQSPMK